MCSWLVICTLRQSPKGLKIASRNLSTNLHNRLEKISTRESPSQSKTLSLQLRVSKMIRNEYLNTKSGFTPNSSEDRKFNHQLHIEYYSQFITEQTKSLARILLNRFPYMLCNNKGENKIEDSLNCIQLRHWNILGNTLTIGNMNTKKWKECEYLNSHSENPGKLYISAAEKVCTLKNAARMILLEKGWTEHWELNKFGNVECYLVKGN